MRSTRDAGSCAPLSSSANRRTPDVIRGFLRGVGLGLVVAGCVVPGCAGGASQGAHGGVTAADHAATGAPLPVRAEHAIPADAHDVLHVDLARARASAELSPMLAWARYLTCLQRDGALTSLLERIALLVLVTWEPAEGLPEFLLLLQGPAGQPGPAPEALLAMVSTPASEPGAAPASQVSQPQVFKQGRHTRMEQGPLSAVALGGALTAFGTRDRVRALLTALDQPGRTASAYFDAQPEAFRPGSGRAVIWVTRGLDPRAAAQVGQVAGGQVGAAIAGIPVHGRLEASPVRAVARGQLRSAEDAQLVANESRRRLQQAALVLKLLGLPLHEQLRLSPQGASLDVDLPLSASQAQRLAKLAEGAVPDAAARVCRDLAAMGLAR